MRVTIAQLAVTPDMPRNKDKILGVLADAAAGDWVTFPEGMLTGYFPASEDFLADVDPAVVSQAVSEIAALVRDRQCACLLGTALFDSGAWYNGVAAIDPMGTVRIYRKVELSTLDRRVFAPGTEVPHYDMAGTRIGIQICRELLFPEPWLRLRKAGARIVFHLNNALKPYDAVWRNVVITRAVEHGYYVCSTNNAAPPQELTSYLAAPFTGELLLEAERQAEQVLTYDLPDADPVSPY